MNTNKGSTVFVLNKDILEQAGPVDVFEQKFDGCSVKAIYENKSIECYFTSEELGTVSKIGAPLFTLPKTDHEVTLTWDIEKKALALFVDGFEVQVHAKIKTEQL